MKYLKPNAMLSILILQIAMIIVTIVGYVLNIVQLIKYTDDYNVVYIIVKVAGIFLVPVGAILGYCGL